MTSKARKKNPVSQSFRKLARERVARDPAFTASLLREGIDTMLTGDVDAGKAILRDYIKAPIGFERLGTETVHSLKG